MKKVLASVCPFVLIAVAGCSSSSNGGGGSSSVSGKAGSSSVATTDTISLVGTQTNNGVQVAFAGAFITNVSGSCAVIQRNGNPRNTTALSLVVATQGASVPAGSYTVGAQGQSSAAEASYEATDSNCNKTTNEKATGGTITLTTVSSTTVTGTFDVTFASGDHLTGNFTAPVCSATLNTSGTQPACGS